MHVEPAVVTGQHYRYDPIQIELEQGALTGLAYTPDDTNYVADGMPLRYTCTTCTHEKLHDRFPDRSEACVHRNQLYREWECVEIVVRGRLFLQFL